MIEHHKPAAHVLARLEAEPWLITQDGLALLIEIASRENVITPNVLERIVIHHEALAAKRASKVDGGVALSRRGPVALIDVSGPIFRYADVFTEVSAATSTETIATDFNAAMNDPTVGAVIFTFDSPGGQASGINELANMIHDARGGKPIGAYIGGMAGSAAYWIASAVDLGLLWIDATGFAGSIGARVSAKKPSAQSSSVEVVSQKSPKKAFDPTTEDGRAELQKQANDLAQVFIDTVARNRGVPSATVEADFGQGRMVMGQEAVDAGLADQVGSLESMIATLKNMTPGKMPTKKPAMPMVAVQETKMSMVEEKRSLLARLGDLLGLTAEATTTTAEAPEPTVAPPEPSLSPEAVEVLRLKKELDDRDAAALTERTSRICAEVDAVMSKYDDRFGKAAAAAFRSRLTAAKTADDVTGAAELCALASALPPIGPTERLRMDGPSAEEIAAMVVPRTEEEVGRLAAARIQKRGVQQGSPAWNSAYIAEVKTLRLELVALNGDGEVANGPK